MAFVFLLFTKTLRYKREVLGIDGLSYKVLEATPSAVTSFTQNGYGYNPEHNVQEYHIYNSFSCCAFCEYLAES